MMRLVIAEKPSVALEISKALGVNKKGQGYYENDQYYVTWCVGHLVTNADPQDYDEKYKKWSLDSLPFIPEKQKTKILPGTKAQYIVIEKLVKQNDVKELICATDAGREGELIFRLVYNKIGVKKPFKRLWISSMEETAILEGFKNLKDGSEYENLYQSALCRSQADFLVGINITRLFSCLYGTMLNVGRVQTPTVNVIVKRQREIENFKPVPFYVVNASKNGFKAYKRVEDENEAKKIVESCFGKTGVIKSVESEEKSENPPTLFDLTTLQRDANRIFGYSAQQTLDIVQTLYEAKLVTYPRTDSKFITEDMEQTFKGTIDKIIKESLVDELSSKYFHENNMNLSKVINNSKVTDHHAIIVTQMLNKERLEKLSTTDRNIATLILYRMIMAVYSKYKYAKTTAVLLIDDTEFTAKGKKVIDQGFKQFEIYFKQSLALKNDSAEEKEESIPGYIEKYFEFQNMELGMEQRFTKAPSPYTEDTLLSAMENAGRFIEDEKLKEAIKSGGLGTPATRAATIEKIIKAGYIERNGKKLVATKSAYTLVDLLPEKFKEPLLTAEWEQRLEEICKGTTQSGQFMADIEGLVEETVQTYKSKEVDRSLFEKKGKEHEVIGICPRCGKNIVDYEKTFSCESGKSCNFTMWKDDKFFNEKKKPLTKAIAKELLKSGRMEIKDLYSPKKDSKYTATVVLVDTGKYVNYKLEF